MAPLCFRLFLNSSIRVEHRQFLQIGNVFSSEGIAFSKNRESSHDVSACALYEILKGSQGFACGDYVIYKEDSLAAIGV